MVDFEFCGWICPIEKQYHTFFCRHDTCALIAGSPVAEISFRVHRFVKYRYYAKKLSRYLLFVSFFDIPMSLCNLFQRKSWSSSNRVYFSLSPSTSIFQFPFCSIYSGLRGSTKCFKSSQNLVLCSDSGGC